MMHCDAGILRFQRVTHPCWRTSWGVIIFTGFYTHKYAIIMRESGRKANTTPHKIVFSAARIFPVRRDSCVDATHNKYIKFTLKSGITANIRITNIDIKRFARYFPSQMIPSALREIKFAIIRLSVSCMRAHSRGNSIRSAGES